MNRKMTAMRNPQPLSHHSSLRFFTETMEVERISPLAFFAAGAPNYAHERFYWENANKTLTLVGLGHAVTLTSERADDRYEEISAQWQLLCATIIKEEKDLDPVLFGGFSFDPENVKKSEWHQFPSAFFVVPSFQLSIKNGKTCITINLITEDVQAAEAFDQLRDERDRLIHNAQVAEFHPQLKPIVTQVEEIGKKKYMEAVRKATLKIQEGQADKVVIARPVKLHFAKSVEGITALHHISNEQQESYHFGLQLGEQLFFGATPERLIEIRDGRAYSACVAGSIKRGKSAEEDRKLGEALLNDQKNRQEHQYVVKMISDVFKELCSEVRMPKIPRLMKIRDIQHLHTPVEGVVESEHNIFTFVQALHPTPALGGTPTTVSKELIRELEQMDRGYYAAPIGWVDAAGNGEFAVAIRSALLDENSAYLYAGGGIVADSDPLSEYEETWVKLRPVLRALGGAFHG